MKIGFVGAGNMGGAILKGYAGSDSRGDNGIAVFDIDKDKVNEICREYRGESCSSVKELTADCDVVILCVKPDKFQDVLPQVAEGYTKDKLVITIAAGVMISFVEKYLGSDAKIIRIMPNTPALVREAMIALCRNGNVNEEDIKKAMDILGSVGKVEEVTEDMIHCVIGVSGSSPAYTFMYIEALVDAAVKNGMEKEKAKKFAAQAVLGAARMVLETEETPEQLRIDVCSPGGTTIEAVNVLFEKGFEDDVKEAFQAAVEKSKEMSK